MYTFQKMWGQIRLQLLEQCKFVYVAVIAHLPSPINHEVMNVPHLGQEHDLVVSNKPAAPILR